MIYQSMLDSLASIGINHCDVWEINFSNIVHCTHHAMIFHIIGTSFPCWNCFIPSITLQRIKIATEHPIRPEGLLKPRISRQIILEVYKQHILNSLSANNTSTWFKVIFAVIPSKKIGWPCPWRPPKKGRPKKTPQPWAAVDNWHRYRKWHRLETSVNSSIFVLGVSLEFVIKKNGENKQILISKWNPKSGDKKTCMLLETACKDFHSWKSFQKKLSNR